MKERMKQILMRLGSIQEELKTAKVEKIDELERESKALIEERNQLEQEMRTKAIDSFNNGIKQEVQTQTANEENEQRAKDFVNKRAIQFGGLDIVKPSHESATINPTFNQVSSLLDQVTIKNLDGGETFKQSYVKKYKEAGETTEGDDYTETEAEFAYADITKVKLTAYAEVTEELKKLPHVDYMNEVKNSLAIALRKKLVNEILFGVGGSGHINGICTANAKAIDSANDITITKIDENTLDNIILSYGSEEEVTPGVLVLGKDSLKEFVKVVGTDKKKVYDIDYKNQTINGIPYIINSRFTAFATANGKYVMVYGSLANYQLVAFSSVELAQSDDFKFKSGQIAFRASGFFGGNVVAYNGFVRIKKTA